MAKPLRSDDPNPPNVQFSHFGVLNDGQRSKGAAITSVSINVTLAALILILGMVVKNNPVISKKVADLTLPPEPPPVAPKPPPPPRPPKIKLPPPPKMEAPKIKMPEPKVQPPPEIKPVVMPTPKVAVSAPAPRKVDPPPAPKVVTIAQPMAAHIANNDAHPTAVRAGYTEIKALNSTPVAARVNLGGGVPGMPSSNTGSGPHAISAGLGSGAPSGTNVNSHQPGAVRIAGVVGGATGGTGRGGPVAVGIAPPVASTPTPHPTEALHSMSSKPTLIFKPKPVYPAEARAAHIEGNVQVHVRVTPSGGTEFLSISRGLGHGLDESARQVVQGMRWKPALDEAGRPIEWTGDVIVVFEMS